MSTFRTLLLDRAAKPHAIISWEDAITHVYEETADVLEEYDETVSSPSTTYFIPAVMQLRNPIVRKKKAIKFSRINVLTRDGFRCCYCGAQKSPKELNLDHVMPRSQGGPTTFENIVTSCIPCNSRKANKTPEQAGMKLLKRPARPHSLPLHTVFVANKIPQIWMPYLQAVRMHDYECVLYIFGCG